MFCDPLNGETLIGLTAAAAPYPAHRGSGRLNPATLTRWILQGAKSTDGSKVKLEAVRCGARWLTSREAMARFFAALNPQSEEPPLVRTEAQRSKAADRASRELEKLGA